MFIVGLTGGIGSGKSTAASLFAQHGVPVVDTDAIAHALTAAGSPVLPLIAEKFGPTILQTDGSLDRAALRQRVFADTAARRMLEDILHPRIREQVEQALLREPDAPYQIVAIPLLFETGAYRHLIDRSLVIDCDETLQVTRTMARSRLSESEVRAIMSAQAARDTRLALADDVIDNSGTPEMLQAQVATTHQKYLDLSAAKQSQQQPK